MQADIVNHFQSCLNGTNIFLSNFKVASTIYSVFFVILLPPPLLTAHPIRRDRLVALQPEKLVHGEHVEEHIGYMCNVVKNTYDGFIAGQVFRFDGFVSEQGSIGDANDHNETHGEHLAIVTYWSSFDEHEKSHANEKFKTAFSDLAEFCEHTFESGYSLLWQGNGLQYKD